MDVVESGADRAAEDFVSEVTAARIEAEKERRSILYEMILADPQYALICLSVWSRDVVAYLGDCWWLADEHGDYGGGCVPYLPYPRQRELLEKLDWMVASRRRRDMVSVKSRQVGLTATVVGFCEHAHRFRATFPIILTSYEEEAIDKSGKFGREPQHLFGKIRYSTDRLVEKLPIMVYNGDSTKKEPRTPDGRFKGEDVTRTLTRPRFIVHGQVIADEARGNVITGDLPDDKTGKSRTYRLGIFDEIGEYRPGQDHAAWGACAPCCRHIFAFGTIPDDAREDCLLHTGTEDPPGTTTAFKFHWTQIDVYLDGAYWKCTTCEWPQDWIYKSPGEEYSRVICEKCFASNTINWNDLRSPWFDDMCSTFNHDKVKIARYLQMDWELSAGDVAFYTFDRKLAVIHRDDVSSWKAMQGFDPGYNVRNPACWVKTMFDPMHYILRVVGYWMKSNVPIEWWYPFVSGIGWEKLTNVKVMSGPHIGKMWLEAFEYSQEEREMIERSAYFPRGTVYGDKYGDAHHGGADAPYATWRRMGIEVLSKGVSFKAGGKWGLIQKFRDLYVPRLEIDPDIANIRPEDDGTRLISILGAVAKVKIADSETGTGESQNKDFDKRTPKNASHPADALVVIGNWLPNRIEGRVAPDGTIEPAPYLGYDDDEDDVDDTYGELLPGSTN